MHDAQDTAGRGHAAGTLDLVRARISRPENRATATEYLRVREVAEHRSVFTRLNDAYALEDLSAFLDRPFAAATRADLMAWVERLDATQRPSTVEVRKTSIRRFYKFLANPDAYLDPRLRARLDPLPAAAWITFRRSWRELPVDEILTEAEVELLVRAADTPRDRAFVAVLYESGARLSEFLALDVRHVQVDDFGAVLTIRRSKTNGRRIRLVLSAPLLLAHLEAHPDPRPTAPLWPSCDARPAYKRGRLRRQSPRDILGGLAKRAGINKPVNPHAFRHARATITAGILTEPEQRQVFGWSASSPTPRLYHHLKGGEAGDKLLQHYGILAPPRPRADAWAHLATVKGARASGGEERER